MLVGAGCISGHIPAGELTKGQVGAVGVHHGSMIITAPHTTGVSGAFYMSMRSSDAWRRDC